MAVSINDEVEQAEQKEKEIARIARKFRKRVSQEGLYNLYDKVKKQNKDLAQQISSIELKNQKQIDSLKEEIALKRRRWR